MTAKKTPMLEQYFRIKEQYPDCLLFFRLGDFYELFFEDARIASQCLNLVLTFRGYYNDKEVPMCGVPFHAYENYLVRLIKCGYKVAICEQIESPQEAKKRGSTAIVKRDVIRIVTSGTLTEEAMLDKKQNNFLMAVVAAGTEFGFAWADISTGEFLTQTAPKEIVQSVIERVNPVEILIADNFSIIHPDLLKNESCPIEQLPTAQFDFTENQRELCSFFNTDYQSFNYLTKSETVAAGVILSYLLNTQKGECPAVSKPQKIQTDAYMAIDAATRRNLELMTSQNGSGKNTSLLKCLDKTLTGSGGRTLAAWLGTPLLDAKAVNARLDKVDYFIQNPSVCESVRNTLKLFPDIERSLSRLVVGRGGPRDMKDIALGLKNIPFIRNQITGIVPESLQEDLRLLGDHSDLVAQICAAVDFENTPLLARDGGFIKQGYFAPLDEQHHARENARRMALQLQLKYSQDTKINGLKITFNNLSGYSIEVPTRFAEPLLINKELGFIHKQTLTNVVRFTTAELSDLEQKVLHSDELALAMELDLFEQLRQKILTYNESVCTTCAAIGRIDIAAAFAVGAVQNGWIRPILTNDTTFDVKNARHPVVEAALKENNQKFIPNNCFMDEDKDRLWILTGPNMAGKSTFMRQNALIVIMAQTGCFVPADYAKIGIVDKLFSRVGASDDLAKGQSTFMVEMTEVAYILQNATDRSFVIFDEVGRGTATYDGLSIAWAVVEYLHEQINCRTLFATHYHELTALVNRLSRVSLHTLRVREWQGEIVFMHEVDTGATDRSYGIHVAKLAGVPTPVLLRSEEILNSLEEKRQNQEPLFDDLPLFSQLSHPTSIRKASPVENELKTTDLDSLSPREALDMLYRLKSMTEA